MKALYIKGVAGEDPTHIKARLEAMGYTVEVVSFLDLNLDHDVQLVVGHSAGAARAAEEFGGSDIQVVALNSPYRPPHNNIIYSQDARDPLNTIAIAFNPFQAQFGQGFIGTGIHVHDKDQSWDAIEGDIQSA